MAVKRSKGCIVNPIVPHRIIAGVFGMAAFVVAILSGLWVDNPVTSILLRALAAMVLCYGLGLVVGWVCEFVVREHLTQYKQAHPVSESGDEEKRLREAKGEVASS